MVGILACWGSSNASLKNVGILKNKGREKGANFRVFSTLEQCLSVFYGVASLKGRPLNMLPTLRNAAHVCENLLGIPVCQRNLMSSSFLIWNGCRMLLNACVSFTFFPTQANSWVCYSMLVCKAVVSDSPHCSSTSYLFGSTETETFRFILQDTGSSAVWCQTNSYFEVPQDQPVRNSCGK